MQHKDENLDITLSKRVQQELDYVKKEIAAQRLKKEKVDQAVQNVFDFRLAFTCNVILSTIRFIIYNCLMVLYKNLIDFLKDYSKELCAI